MTTFHNPSLGDIRELLRAARTIAVIGISDNPARPSHGVTTSMRDFGYRILPVNPALTEWQGIPAQPTGNTIPLPVPGNLPIPGTR